MRTVILLIEVKAPDEIPDDEVAGSVNRMLESGWVDASDMAEDADMDEQVVESARMALSLEVGCPEVIPDPRVRK